MKSTAVFTKAAAAGAPAVLLRIAGAATPPLPSDSLFANMIKVLTETATNAWARTGTCPFKACDFDFAGHEQRGELTLENSGQAIEIARPGHSNGKDQK